MDNCSLKDDISMTYKCRVCRTVLFEGNALVNSHGNDLSAITTDMDKLPCDCGVYYIRGDATLLPWVERLVVEANWLKGKLICPKCSSRLGSFDFVCGRQCECKLHVLPPIHVIKSKIDRDVIYQKTT